jgi:aspartate carbamoyltransferase catalytic subunit
MTRLQRERIDGELERLSDDLILDKAKLAQAKKDLLILHPLPRNEEIAVEVDDDPRALYFKQAEYGLYIRMALLISLLENKNAPSGNFNKTDKRCANINCIINDPQDTSNLPQLEKSNGACAYCEHNI